MSKASTNVVSIQTSDSNLPDVANMTPDELAAKFKELAALQRQMASVAKELEKRNEGKVSELEFEIFSMRALARVYLKAAKKAYDTLREYQPSRVRVVFGKKGNLMEQYRPFVERFKREVDDMPDARLLADPEDLGADSEV